MDYQTTIGLEVHAELHTRTKLFCGCAPKFGAPQNTHVCPVCIGMPGSLPVMNRDAFEMAVKAALAFNCTVETKTVFDRKNYYYPDLPKNYQISQNYLNLGTDGFIDIPVQDQVKRIGITNIHLEEDAGKSVHPEGSGAARSMIDLNRAGTPLLEIVSAPDMHSIKETAAYMHTVRSVLLYLGISTCRMEQGVLRFEASISLAPPDSKELGSRVEIKNLNSIKAVQKVLHYETERQKDMLSAGEAVPSETLLWNEELERSETMRSKEAAQDYRYFPEPDLVPVVMTKEHITELNAGLPELPLQRHQRFLSEYGLSEYDAGVLVQDRAIADYFEETARKCGDPKAASNWVMNDVLSSMKEKGVDASEFAKLIPPASLADTIAMVIDGTVNMTSAKQIYSRVIETGETPKGIREKMGLAQISDDNELDGIVDAIIEENPKAVEDFKAGKKQATGFLTGQIMRKTNGQANPRKVNEILRKKLS